MGRLNEGWVWEKFRQVMGFPMQGKHNFQKNSEVKIHQTDDTRFPHSQVDNELGILVFRKG